MKRLPGNEEVEQALRDYNSLFQYAEQPARLRLQRLEALRWMERLSQWNPVLTGAVAAGWATEHSEVRLELEAEDAKSVELSLINAGVEYACAPAPAGNTPQSSLRIERPEATLRLVILSPLRAHETGRGAEVAATPTTVSAWRSSRLCSTPRAKKPSLRGASISQPGSGGEREVGEDGVGPRTLEGKQRLHHAGALV